MVWLPNPVFQVGLAIKSIPSRLACLLLADPIAALLGKEQIHRGVCLAIPLMVPLYPDLMAGQ